MEKNKKYLTNITDDDELEFAKQILENMKSDCEDCCSDDELN